jgi:hypothetical protein
MEIDETFGKYEGLIPSCSPEECGYNARQHFYLSIACYQIFFVAFEWNDETLSVILINNMEFLN